MWVFKNDLIQNWERSMSKLCIVTCWNQDFWRNINNLRHADDATLMLKSKEELKHQLMKAKEKSEKAGLKLNIQITKIMASGPITSW